LGEKYGRECAWPAEPTAALSEFHTENNSFSYGCAAAAHCIVRDSKPRRLVEIGSGRSSHVLSAALGLDQSHGAPPAEYTVVDPFPPPLLESLPGAAANVIAECGELVEPGLFRELNRGTSCSSTQGTLYESVVMSFFKYWTCSPGSGQV
jgi:hypothetical protein